MTKQDVCFYSDNWPELFLEEFNDASSDMTKAWITAERIRWFILTDGTDQLKKQKESSVTDDKPV